MDGDRAAAHGARRHPDDLPAVWPLATATDVSVIVKVLIALVGLAIAIDYALLVVVRWREERQRGADGDDAVVAAMQHAGRAVVFSGTTVGISLLALVALPVPFLRSIGIAGMLIPLISVAVAITLLPVVLATSARGSTVATRAAKTAPAAAGRPGRASSSGTAGARRSSRPPCSARLVVAASTIQLGNPQAESLAQAGPARARSISSRSPASAPGRCRRSTRSSAPVTPRAVDRDARGCRRRRGVVAPADWHRDGTSLITVIPTADGNSPAGRETLDRVRAPTRRRRP